MVLAAAGGQQPELLHGWRWCDEMPVLGATLQSCGHVNSDWREVQREMRRAYWSNCCGPAARGMTVAEKMSMIERAVQPKLDFHSSRWPCASQLLQPERPPATLCGACSRRPASARRASRTVEAPAVPSREHGAEAGRPRQVLALAPHPALRSMEGAYAARSEQHELGQPVVPMAWCVVAGGTPPGGRLAQQPRGAFRHKSGSGPRCGKVGGKALGSASQPA